MGSPVQYSADAEEKTFVDGLSSGFLRGLTFTDDLFARCADAMAQAADGSGATPMDVGVLIRQVLRRGSERDGSPLRLQVPMVPGLPQNTAEWQRVGVTGVLVGEKRLRLEAEPYRPSWIVGDSPVDAAAAAGTSVGERAQVVSIPADPFFTMATGYQTYKTPGQQAAVRAAVTMPAGGTLIAELPTGTGKTEIAVTLSKMTAGQTVVIVVPTIALAYDFERRFRELRGHSRTGQKLAFAWTSTTGEEQRKAVRNRLRVGDIPLLVTSPESLNGTLHSALLEAAAAGRIAALVIDEAHLVTQWGRDFRPDFRELASLREDMLARAAAGGWQEGLPKTVLLSATLGPDELLDLSDLFGSPGPVSLVAANMLRPEPDYWIANWSGWEERRTRLLDALAHLPRPLVLYVTRPDQARQALQDITEAGYGRTAVVTGETAGEERRDVLEGIRAGDGRSSRFDLVIATSAFGLGIDYPGVRSVVHACLPETIDRWYQEVGRAGRDGHASVTMLIPSEADVSDALKLGVTTLTPELAQSRWKHLWTTRQEIGCANYVDLQSPPPRTGHGSFNLRWNVHLLRALAEMGQITRQAVSPWHAEELGLPSSARGSTWERVALVDDAIHAPNFFQEKWVTWRDRIAGPSVAAFNAMRTIVDGKDGVCDVICQVYAPDDAVWERFDLAAGSLMPSAGCGRCPSCRRSRVPVPVNPPRFPEGRWMTSMPTSPALLRLFDACPSGERLAVLTDPQPTERARTLAPLLGNAGIIHFAGPVDWSSLKLPRGACIDPTPATYLASSPPLASLRVLGKDEEMESRQFSAMRRPRDVQGDLTPIIVLLSRPDSGARLSGQLISTVPAGAAEEILRGKAK